MQSGLVSRYRGRRYNVLLAPPPKPINGVFDEVLLVAWNDGKAQMEKGLLKLFSGQGSRVYPVIWANAVLKAACEQAGTARYPIFYGRANREAFSAEVASSSMPSSLKRKRG